MLTFTDCMHGSTGYVWKSSGPLAAGKTLTMQYTLSGSGTFETPGDSLPATVSLFLQRAGDEGMTGAGAAEWYRLWSVRTVLKLGDTAVSQALQPNLWTGVKGRPPTAAQFADVLGNLVHVGFTFGGRDFAGHGVCAKGPTTLTLNAYAVN